MLVCVRNRKAVRRVAASLMLAMLAAFVVSRVAGRPKATTSARPTSGPSATTPAPGATGPVAGPTLPSASPSPKATCAQGDPGGRQEPWLDSADGWSVTSGTAALSAVAGPATGTSGLKLDNGQKKAPASAATMLAQPVDLSAAPGFVVSIKQNGNLSTASHWAIRLRTTPRDYFERVFPEGETRRAIGTWCQDRSVPGDWVVVGSPSWARITAVEVNVPAYEGTGAGNVVSYARFGLLP